MDFFFSSDTNEEEEEEERERQSTKDRMQRIDKDGIKEEEEVVEEEAGGGGNEQPLALGTTLVIVNNFAAEAVSFLNEFGNLCESRLNDVSKRLSRAESSVSILEAKLKSVPGLHDKREPIEREVVAMETIEADKVEDEPVETIEDEETPLEEVDISAYMKMLKVGVPRSTIVLKMEADGIDPTLLSEIKN